ELLAIAAVIPLLGHGEDPARETRKRDGDSNIAVYRLGRPRASKIAIHHLKRVSVSKVGGIFVHKRREGRPGQKSTHLIREDTMQEQLTPEQEAQAQELAALVSEAIAADVLQVARLLVSKKTKDTFGQTEFQLRDLTHQ